MSDRKLRTKCPCCGEFLHNKDGDIVCVGCGYEDWSYYIRQANRRSSFKSDKVPVGCEACGGPYPLCKDSCNIFDT